MSKKSEQSESIPGVYKADELEAMIEMIDAGLWGTKNLSTALHVSQETIIQWKKRPEVQDAHRRAIKKFIRRRTDVEKILSEMEVDTPQEKQNIQITVIPILGGYSALPSNHSHPQDIIAEEADTGSERGDISK